MIYVTGDTHIPLNIEKLDSAHFPQQNLMCKDDYLIICGDFGGLFFDSHEERLWRQWLSQRSFTTLFVDGNHENFDLLSAYPVTMWHGGQVQFIEEHLIHLMRGEVYTIDGMTFFTMGGASSFDRIFRIEGSSWWSQELPSSHEIEHARQNLEQHGNQVDYIITHTTCSALIKRLIKFSFTDYLNKFFDYMEEHVAYHHWYFGHLHLDIEIDDRHTALFNQIKPIPIAPAGI